MSWRKVWTRRCPYQKASFELLQVANGDFHFVKPFFHLEWKCIFWGGTLHKISSPQFEKLSLGRGTCGPCLSKGCRSPTKQCFCCQRKRWRWEIPASTRWSCRLCCRTQSCCRPNTSADQGKNTDIYFSFLTVCIRGANKGRTSAKSAASSV